MATGCALMRKLYLLHVTALLAFLVGCSSVPTKDIKVDAQADSKVNFSGYKTYAWLGSATALNDPEGHWKPRGFDAEREIRYVINRELRARGMSENSVDPDFLVAFAFGVDMQALHLKQDPGTRMDVLTNVPKAGLVMVLVDPDTGFVIWAGLATGEVQRQPDAATAKARLDYAVTQLIRKIPK